MATLLWPQYNDQQARGNLRRLLSEPRKRIGQELLPLEGERVGPLSPEIVYEKARTLARKALAMDENLLEARLTMVVVKEEWDWDFQGAEKEYRSVLAANPNHALTLLVCQYAIAGQPEKAREHMKEVVELRNRGQILSSRMALARYFLGEIDEAIDWFERAYEEHDVWLLDIKTWVCCEQPKEHVRIRKLLQRIGLPL